MRSIFRPTALVEAWFDNLRAEQQRLARTLDAAVLQAAPGMTRVVKWGNLVYLHEGAHAVAIVMHRDHANLQVFNGAALAVAFPELEGTGKGLRHLKFRYHQPPDLVMVARVVVACIGELQAPGRPLSGHA